MVCGLNVYAQECPEVVVASDTLQVYFRQNKIELDVEFRENGSQLKGFSRRFNSLLKDSLSRVKSVKIVSGASPEGSSSRNRYLSDNRAKVVRDYLVKQGLIDSLHIEVDSRGVDWQGLQERVERSDYPFSAEVLEILSQPEWIVRNGKVVDSRKNRLLTLDGGNPWRELYSRYFPDLRGTRVMIVYDVINPKESKPDMIIPKLELSAEGPDVEAVVDEVAVDSMVVTNRVWKPFYMAVKTNMLYDAALVPNIGVEFYLGKKWSLAANWMYSWWKNDRVHNYWRTYGGDIEVRRWLGDTPLRGHHFGLYAQMVTYDFELTGRGYLGDKWSYGVGVSYGYSLPVARRLNIDFTIGVGYLRGKYKEYLPLDGHYVWQSTHMRNQILPTKVEISLVWLLGRGNYNARKGGGR